MFTCSLLKDKIKPVKYKMIITRGRYFVWWPYIQCGQSYGCNPAMNGHILILLSCNFKYVVTLAKYLIFASPCIIISIE